MKTETSPGGDEREKNELLIQRVTESTPAEITNLARKHAVRMRRGASVHSPKVPQGLFL